MSSRRLKQPDPCTLESLRRRLSADSSEARRAGERVRVKRKDRGFTQFDLAEAIQPGFPVQTISKVEKGQIVPRDYLKAAIALSLHCEIHDLWPWPTRADLLEVAS